MHFGQAPVQNTISQAQKTENCKAPRNTENGSPSTPKVPSWKNTNYKRLNTKKKSILCDFYNIESERMTFPTSPFFLFPSLPSWEPKDSLHLSGACLLSEANAMKASIFPEEDWPMSPLRIIWVGSLYQWYFPIFSRGPKLFFKSTGPVLFDRQFIKTGM